MKGSEEENQVLKWIKQFCKFTCLQGPKYIVDEKETLLGRIIWGIIVLSSGILGIYLILVTNSKINERFVLTSVDSSFNPVSNALFPAITICDVNKVYKPAAIHFAHTLKLPVNTTVEDVIAALPLLSGLSLDTFPEELDKSKFEWLQNILDDNEMEIKNVLRKVSTPCNKLIVRCRLKGLYFKCNKRVRSTATAYGFCCSINYVYPESPIQVQEKDMQNLLRFSSCGHRTGLSLIVNIEPNEYMISSVASPGVKVIIHGPKSIPGGTMAGQTFIKTKQDSRISISPFNTRTEPELDNLAPADRKCYFQKERNVTHLQRYTYDNCIMKCRQKKTKQLCGCSTFYQRNEPVCSLRDLPCLYENFGDLNFGDARKWNDCDCYPECSPNIYTFTMTNVRLNNTFSVNEAKLFSRIPLTNHSIIHISYRDLVGTRNRISVATTYYQMLGDYGGILSLFLGFSFMWFIELLYFFTLRLFLVSINKRKQMKTEKNNFEKFNLNNIRFTRPRRSRAEFTNHSIINISYRDLVSTRYRIAVSTTYYQMLGSYGGILSLFFGFSFMWFIEILYFFTLRALMEFNHKRKQVKIKQDPPRALQLNTISYRRSPRRLFNLPTYHH